jgi:phage terminase small subunit
MGDMVKARAAKSERATAMATFEDEGVTRAKQAAFVIEYPKDWNGAAAAKRAGYAVASAKEIAYELLTLPHIKAAIERRQSEMAALAAVDTAMVVKDLYDIATADARELVSVYLDCCRHCWGIDGQRQWTRGEYAAALDAATAKGDPAPPLAGGIGYNGTLKPNPECSECFGRGVEVVHVKDSRTLTGKAAKLYAGAQQTKEGIKAIGRDQNFALQALGRYVGIFKDKTEMTGPGGGPIQVMAAVATAALTSLTNEELEAHLLSRGVKLPQPALEATIER